MSTSSLIRYCVLAEEPAQYDADEIWKTTLISFSKIVQLVAEAEEDLEPKNLPNRMITFMSMFNDDLKRASIAQSCITNAEQVADFSNDLKACH